MDDEMSLGDLGIEDPERPLPRHHRHTVDLSAAAAAQRKIEAAARRVDADIVHRKIDVPAIAEPVMLDWVHKVRAYTAPASLGVSEVIPRMAVEGLIQEAKVGSIVGAGGTSKTTVQMHLGICHTTGRDFMGHKVKRGNFVLLSNDDSQEDLEGALTLCMKSLGLSDLERNQVCLKLRAVSLQGEQGLKVFTTTAAGAVVPTGLEEHILEAVRGIPDLVGIGLDTLRQFSGGSSNDEQVIKLTISAATEVARRTGAYVLMAHHTGKQNYRDGIADLYAGSGSAAIADNCRFVLVLQAAKWVDVEGKVQRTGQEGGDPLVLTPTRGSLLVRASGPVYMHRDGFYIGRIAGAPLTRDQQEDERDRAVLRAVRQGPDGGASKNQIAAFVKGRRTAALERIDALELRGLLLRTGPSGSPKFIVSGTGSSFLDTAE